MTDPDTILLETEEAMEKALNYLKQELRGIRTGRAHPALVEFVKVDYYGSMTDLKALASVSVPEPTQLLIRPFDAGAIMAIKHGIEQAGLGLNPMPEGKQIRINVPALSQERRLKLAGQCKKNAEEQKIAIRNVRRDANKAAEGDAELPEDEQTKLKDEVEKLTKTYTAKLDALLEGKTKELMEV